MSIRKLLVANRGEIAVRIFRTCRELGIATVAVVASDDVGSLHARTADESVEITSYLHSEEHIRAATASGADAIHPGYGFLAENADFAAAVEAAGPTWVGPSPEALRLGGDKLAAKRIAREAGVPVLPDGTPEEIGFPLLVKAAAGGGGRGMRVVRSAAALEDALAAAGREAAGAFGDGTLYCERYLERPRHVEVQLLADPHGTVVAVGERDCSVQRRHQKIIEEAPSPAMPADARERLRDLAIRSVLAAGYESAGTLEFLLDQDGSFYFIEINCRIQVEHPVTELLTGVDLITEQIRIAAGERLSLRQETITIRGHAIEFRINAEDPSDNFSPQTGEIEHLALPGGPGVRVDTHLYPGYEVPPFYDSLLAKVIVWGEDRDMALARSRRALGELEIGGIRTNVPFHRGIIDNDAFLGARVSTNLLDRVGPAAFVAG